MTQPNLTFKTKQIHFRDALITCIVNTCTCLTAGVLVFSILGNMAHLQNTDVNSVARHGPGLVFLTYPELVLTLPASFIWAILFFSMLLVRMFQNIESYYLRMIKRIVLFLVSNRNYINIQVLGIDTEFCSVESLITGIVDNWEEKLLPHRKKVAVVICIICFFLGLPMVTKVRFNLIFTCIDHTINIRRLINFFQTTFHTQIILTGWHLSIPNHGLLCRFWFIFVVDLFLRNDCYFLVLWGEQICTKH